MANPQPFTGELSLRRRGFRIAAATVGNGLGFDLREARAGPRHEGLHLAQPAMVEPLGSIGDAAMGEREGEAVEVFAIVNPARTARRGKLRKLARMPAGQIVP